MTLLSRLFPKRPQKRSAIDPPVARPDADARALLSQGESAYRAQQWASAREKVERAAALEPRSAQAHYLLGALALRDGDVATGVESLRRAVALQPDKAEYHYSLASTLSFNGRPEDAIDSYRAALNLNPGALDWRIELAAILAECDRIGEAVAAFRPAGHPGDAAELYDLGSALQERKRLRAAVAAFRESARLQPDAAATHLMLAACLRDIGMVVEAESPARQATRTGPDMPEGWFILGNVLARQARHEEAVEQYRKAIELVPDYDAPWRSMLFAMNYSQRWTAREVYEAHLESGKRFPRLPAPAIASSHRQTGHRLRLGYLSGDFCRHPVAYFIEPVLQHHSRGQFEVFCYHTLSQEDDVTARLKSQAEHWRAVGKLSEVALEQALRADDLDILVELSGHSDGHRLAVVARRVAPVQVSYLGYPNTTGLEAVDYRITDARADPPGEADALHVEQLVRLPETFLCYAPPFSGDFAPVPPVLERGYITYGSFNNFAKLSPKNIALWARVLAAVPGSKLLIKAQGLQDAGLRRLVFERFHSAGVGSHRLQLAPPTPTLAEHMQSYAGVDIALDTFPYHGTTTTMDALWMGVPVVTLEGDRHASRVSASILSTLSLQELIASSTEQYLAIARTLAGDPVRLQALRASLRERLRSSPLMNGERFTRRLEEAYLQMWQAALRGHVPGQ